LIIYGLTNNFKGIFMDIREYVAHRNKFTLKQMAHDIGCSYSHLHHIMSRTMRPSYDFAKKIELYTRGKVKAVEIMEWELKRKAPSKPRGPT
jgi:hypothetical protein